MAGSGGAKADRLVPETVMPRGNCTFRQRDVTALLKAVRDAGYEPARLVIEPQKMSLETTLKASTSRGGDQEVPPDSKGENEWDDVLSGPNTPKAL